jgi:linalool 8-monooxygenase
VHTQYRKIMMPAVAPGRLAGIEERITQRCRALLDAIPLGEPVDLVQALSAPLPLMTLCELFDLPPEIGWHDLYDWTNAFVGEDDPEFRQSPEQMAQVLGSFFALMQTCSRRGATSPARIWRRCWPMRRSMAARCSSAISWAI